LDPQGWDDEAGRVEAGTIAGAGTEGGEKAVVEAGTGVVGEAATKESKELGADSVS